MQKRKKGDRLQKKAAPKPRGQPMTNIATEPCAQIDDQVLIQRIKAGDDIAYQEIVSRYRDRIYGRVWQLLRNREDAEEVVQDAFIRAHRGLKDFRGEASFSTWLYQIATNLAHNKYWYWRRRRRDQSFSIDKPLAEDSSSTIADLLPSGDDDPYDTAKTQELVDRISECMPKLKARHREILKLRTIENLSYEEIAQKLKISVGTVKSRIARAREALRKAVGAEFQQ